MQTIVLAAQGLPRRVVLLIKTYPLRGYVFSCPGTMEARFMQTIVLAARGLPRRVVLSIKTYPLRGYVFSCPGTMEASFLLPGHEKTCAFSQVFIVSGEGGIRTLGTGLSPYNGLANRPFRPLRHLSCAIPIGNGKIITEHRILQKETMLYVNYIAAS